MIWHNLENDADAPLRPWGILAQLYWALLKGKVKEVNFWDSFSNDKQ